jgi:hypothetical protein
VTIGCQQHQLRANDDAVGQRQAAGPLHKLATHLAVVEFDRCRHSSHAITFVNLAAVPSSRQNFRRTALSVRGVGLATAG